MTPTMTNTDGVNMHGTFGRLAWWDEFSAAVREHVTDYTIPQYGDYPYDQMSEASIEDIKHNITRYLNRMKSNIRGPVEAERDLLKIAHYASIIWSKNTGRDKGVRLEPETMEEALSI